MRRPLTTQVLELEEMLTSGWAVDPETRGPEVVEGWRALKQHHWAKQSREARAMKQAEKERQYQSARNRRDR